MILKILNIILFVYATKVNTITIKFIFLDIKIIDCRLRKNECNQEPFLV